MWHIIGLGAACLTTFAFIPQIIRCWRIKSVRDVSPVTLTQLSLGVSLWVLYGLHLKNWIIILANSITLVSLFILSCMYFIYRKRI